MKTSFQKIVAFAATARGYLDHCQTCGEPAESLNPSILGSHDSRVPSRHKFVPRKETRFTYALNRLLSQTGESIDRPIKEKLAAIEIDNCLTAPYVDEPTKGPDPTGEILKDSAGNLKFSKEGRKAANEAQSMLLNADEIKIQPHFVSKVPSDVTDDMLDSLIGFVLEAETVEAIRAKREAALSDDDDQNVTVDADREDASISQPEGIPF